MDLSKVKLIVSDRDGTLLNSKEEVSDLFFEQFNELQKLGIHFIAASGRQYNSMVHKLQPIKDQITIIAENGGIAKRKEELILMQIIDPDKIAMILPTIRKIPNIFVVFCSEHTAFIESKDPKLIDMFKEYYGAYEIVNDLATVSNQVPILKIALYHSKSSEKYIYPELQQFKNELLLKISGKNWLDISEYASNKGTALKAVQERMNISPSETMVFGDYMNDIEMMDRAYFSYAMKNAHPDIVKTASFITESNNDFGVEKVLAKVIESKQLSQ